MAVTIARGNVDRCANRLTRVSGRFSDQLVKRSVR